MPPSHVPSIARSWPLGKRAKAALIRLLQTRILNMDIHPSATIDPTALVDRTWPKGVHIGANCQIAEEAVILTHDLTRGIYYDTRIGANCRLGPRAIIMPGIVIGDRCIVHAGAVVTKDVPPASAVMGNPARIVPAG